MRNELDLKRGTNEIERARRVASLSPAELKRFAARAVGERDEEALWELFEAHLMVGGASKNTLRSYRTGLRSLLEGFEGVELLRASASDGQLYVFNLARGTDECPALAPATVRSRVAAANAFYRALWWTGVTSADPFRNVQLPTLRERGKTAARGRAVTEEELRALLRLASEQGDVELEVLLLLGAHAGLRAQEIGSLRWVDLDIASLRLRVAHGKGDVARVVRISQRLARVLSEWKQIRMLDGGVGEFVLRYRSQPWMYQRLERAWREALPDAGVEGAHRVFQGRGVHGLRHYAGVRLARESKDLQVVRDHLGHASVRTTEVYAGSTEGAEEVTDW